MAAKKKKKKKREQEYMKQVMLCGFASVSVTPETENFCSCRTYEQNTQLQKLVLHPAGLPALITRFYPRAKRNKGFQGMPCAVSLTKQPLETLAVKGCPMSCAVAPSGLSGGSHQYAHFADEATEAQGC